MSPANHVYLDYNATTPCHPQVVSAMAPYWSEVYGNASSQHFAGRKAKRAIDGSREAVASSVGCYSDELLFTSGATEANNLAILGLCSRRKSRQRVLVSAIEHKSVLEPCLSLRELDFDVEIIPVSCDGVIDLSALSDLIDSNTLLVCVQSANNEIGTLQPIEEVCQISHAKGAFVHCDATQSLGKVKFSVSESDVDFASFSAHKIYGPKGIGALFVRSKRHLQSIVFGGGQEDELRPGTLNVPGIVGFGAACHLSQTDLAIECKRIRQLRDRLQAQLLSELPSANCCGRDAARLPGTLNIGFLNVPADAVLSRTPLLSVGLGSACTAGAIEPSHVLLAIGIARDDARNHMRFSIGRFTTADDIDFAFAQIVANVRSIESLLR